MKIYRFDEKTGKRVDKFGSDLFFSRIAWLNGAAKVSCFHLAPNGKVGYHQAVTPQLFLVVQGSGWARDEVSEPIPVTANQAVFWDKDEWHESGTNTGLTAIVIESESLNPSELIPLSL
jgi:hypothetical protein